ncbi:UNVERIFIED_CONTAM: ggr-1 [Trichonephila clavipes]
MLDCFKHFKFSSAVRQWPANNSAESTCILRLTNPAVLLRKRNYTSLMVNFYMTRRLTGSVMNVYIPSTMIVIMSFVGFWLSVEHVPARVALSVTSLLTLCTQQKPDSLAKMPPYDIP